MQVFCAAPGHMWLAVSIALPAMLKGLLGDSVLRQERFYEQSLATLPQAGQQKGRLNQTVVGPFVHPCIPPHCSQVVVDRIFARMVACAGLPMVAGVALLVLFAGLKKAGGDEFPVWPAYVSQGVTLMGGLLGGLRGAGSQACLVVTKTGGGQAAFFCAGHLA
jgi:hypothetical protein